MSIADVKSSILKGDFDLDFSLLYQETKNARGRYLSALERFEAFFGGKGEILLFSAPGRTEVGGNHTDHQHGAVLAGAVSLDVIAVVRKNKDGVIRLQSEGYPLDTVYLSNLVKEKSEEGKSISLIKGVCNAFKEKGYKLGGFDAYTTSNVLKGSGLSSSAAFEVLLGTVLNHLYCEGGVDPVSIAKIAQRAENTYFGKPCGLMDQMACSLGSFIAIDFENISNPVAQTIPFDLSKVGHSLVIVNTGGNHASLTNEYALITEEMRSVSSYFGKACLREVNEAQFYSKIKDIRAVISDRAILRAIHFFDENKRAIAQKTALKNNNFNEFLRLVNESGRSSYCFLQNVYTNSLSCANGLAKGIYVSQKLLNGRGAVRVHGGGFAGTIQAFVPNDMLSFYRSNLETVFGKGSVYVLNIRPVGGYKLSFNKNRAV